MTYRRMIENYYNDVNNLADLLGKLTVSYRTLIGSADDLNKMVFSSKSDVKKALKRAEELGDVIELIIYDLENCTEHYLKYCRSKTTMVKNYTKEECILREIDEELKL